MVEKILIAEKAEVSARPDGIISVRWSPGVRILEQDALAAMEAVDSLSHGNPTVLLIDMSGISELQRAARMVFARRCSARRIALVGASPVDKVIVTFFLGLCVLPCPTHYFSGTAEAKAWLLAGRSRLCGRKKGPSRTAGE